MGYTKPLVKAAGTAIQTGIEKGLRKLPVEQADFITKAFGFKPKSPQHTFVTTGGIHPTEGAGLVNYIKRGEFQDLGEHITHATQGEQGALNEIARISDDSMNQLNEDTIKANGLKQANAKYESQVNELTDLRAEGERKLQARGGQDTGISALSTGPEFISGDKRIYQLSSKLREPYKVYEETLAANPIAKEFHHRFNKAVSVPYFQRAWELVDAGLASPEDIIALHRYALDKGVPAGDRQSAMMMFERIPHNEFHEFIRSIGLEPRSQAFPKTGTRKGGKTRARPSTNSPLKMEQSRIKKFETIEDLAADFQQAVDDTIVPMNEQAELLQEAWQAVDIQLRDQLMDTWNKRNAARKAGNKELATRLNKEYSKLKKQAISDMKTNRARYGKELDEFGNPDPESYGRAEIKKELKEDKQLRGAE